MILHLHPKKSLLHSSFFLTVVGMEPFDLQTKTSGLALRGRNKSTMHALRVHAARTVYCTRTGTAH